MIYVLSGGGSGATLVVTGVAGDTCTITKGTKTHTKTFGTDKKAIIDVRCDSSNCIADL